MTKGLLASALVLALCGSAQARVGGPAAGDCDMRPTGLQTRDHWLHFKLPPGLMPDKQFDGRPGKLAVHRVMPVYEHGRCASVPSRAAVLLHGRSIPGEVTFDQEAPGPGGGGLSFQELLALEGIDTFAPSLLGYGRSTRFDEGLDDPGNASLPALPADGSCAFAPAGCDRSPLETVMPLDQQRTLLSVNPLAGTLRAHSSHTRFATADVWARDIRQVVDDAIARARPDGGTVTVVGYSAGGQRLGRMLDTDRNLPEAERYVGTKVRSVVFIASLFGGPIEEPTTDLPTFPLTLQTRASVNPSVQPAGCDHVVTGDPQRVWDELMRLDTAGRDWGGEVAGQPTGLLRIPTFIGFYGWNTEAASRLTLPTLVVQGLQDKTAQPRLASDMYGALAGPKVLLHLQCSTHQLLAEGCGGPRCTPAAGDVYGGEPDEPWAGPRATLAAAITEWMAQQTFDGAATGRFVVDASGVAAPAP